MASKASNNGVEYLVQDDASSEYYGPDIVQQDLAVVERNERNLGFPENANRGASRATGDILFFVNQDVFAIRGWSDGWDTAILAAFQDVKVGVVGARLLHPSGVVQSAGGEFDAKGQPYHRFLWHSGLNDPEVSRACEVSWTTGAALATRRTLWQEIGGFNPEYGRGYFEDVEYCLRARELGFKIWYQPECTLVHSVASTGGSPEFERNAQRFKQRWRHKIKPDCAEIKVNFW